ncbi:arrestin domain-containing protein 3-like [Diadema antillarum]|uniref:arrestin domain-containing protein 3-like n=1 Tax=Diadema antillarum TaxID=105358 RepID=UPI003A892C15
MGKLAALDILFVNNKDVYQPGEVVQGEVRIVTNEQKGDIRGIQIECCGRAYTHWSEQRGSGDRRRTVHYRWRVDFFDLDMTLRGAGKNNNAADRIVLPPGDHRFPFSFRLPDKRLPPPLEGTYGWVRYWVKVTIDRPWKFDHHGTRYFSVMTFKDLRHIPNILSPQEGSMQKTVCCCCCESGPIVLNASVDKQGYVPGERLVFSARLNNNSNRSIHNVRAQLQQKVTWTAHHGSSTHTRRSSKLVAEVKLDGCEEMGSLNYENLPLLITPIPPNNFESCPNIDVRYVVAIVGDVAGTPFDLEVPFPVTIGTVPAIARPHAPPQPPPVQQQPQAYPQPHMQQPSLSQGYPPSQGPPPPQGHYQQPPQVPPHPQPQQQLQPPLPPQTQQTPPQSQPNDVQRSGMLPSNKVFPADPPPAVDMSAGYQPALDEVPLDDLPPPPTYEMAIGGAQEIPGEEGNFGTITYAPRYPFYNYGGALTELQTLGQPVTTQPQSSI